MYGRRLVPRAFVEKIAKMTVGGGGGKVKNTQKTIARYLTMGGKKKNEKTTGESVKTYTVIVSTDERGVSVILIVVHYDSLITAAQEIGPLVRAAHGVVIVIITHDKTRRYSFRDRVSPDCVIIFSRFYVY